MKAHESSGISQIMNQIYQKNEQEIFSIFINFELEFELVTLPPNKTFLEEYTKSLNTFLLNNITISESKTKSVYNFDQASIIRQVKAKDRLKEKLYLSFKNNGINFTRKAAINNLIHGLGCILKKADCKTDWNLIITLLLNPPKKLAPLYPYRQDVYNIFFDSFLNRSYGEGKSVLNNDEYNEILKTPQKQDYQKLHNSFIHKDALLAIKSSIQETQRKLKKKSTPFN